MNKEDLILQKLDKIDQRLDKVDQRLDKVDQRLDKVDQRLDKVDQRLDKVDQRLDKVDQRLDKVDQRLDGIELEFVGFRGELDMVYATALETQEWIRRKDKEDGIANNNIVNIRKIPELSTRLEVTECVVKEHDQRLGQLEKA